MARYLDIPDDFKFTEEPIEIRETFGRRDDSPTNFNITFGSNKTCQIKDNNPAIGDTQICKNCYYKKFAEKMADVRKSKRRDFLNYQMNLRENKEVFLTELDEMIVDNEGYFDDVDYSIAREYRQLIKDIQRENSFEESENGDSNSIGLNDFISLLSNAETTEREFTLDIFISHSSADKQVAKRLIQVLKEAMNIESSKIRCTSVEGYKLEGGVNTDEQLRKEVEDNKVFIGIISEHSIQSHYVLFELGARWGLNLPFKPVVISSEIYSSLKAPIKNYNVLNLSNQQDVIQLLEETSALLKKPLESANVFLNSIGDLINEIK